MQIRKRVYTKDINGAMCVIVINVSYMMSVCADSVLFAAW